MLEHTLDAYRIFWLQVCAYVAFIIAGAWWLRRSAVQQLRHTRPRQHRLLVAAYLALVFTPSVVGDLWLVVAPGPALLGYLILFPPIFVHMFSAPRDILQDVQATALLHLLPIGVVCAVVYAILCARGRCRSVHMARSI